MPKGEIVSAQSAQTLFAGSAGSQNLLLVCRMIDIVRRLVVAELAILTSLTF